MINQNVFVFLLAWEDTIYIIPNPLCPLLPLKGCVQLYSLILSVEKIVLLFYSVIQLAAVSDWLYMLPLIDWERVWYDIMMRILHLNSCLLSLGWQSHCCTAAGEYNIYNWCCVTLDSQITSEYYWGTWTRFEADDCPAFLLDSCPCLYQVTLILSLTFKFAVLFYFSVCSLHLVLVPLFKCRFIL